MSNQKPTQSKADTSAQKKEHPFSEIFGAKPSNSKAGQTFVTFFNKPKNNNKEESESLKQPEPPKL